MKKMDVPRQILLIEPDKILASQTEEFLASKGYQVTVAHTAQVAIVEADRKSPDIVVLEVLLTKHSGIEFLYEFRSYTEWQNVPVIIFSRVTKSELGLFAKTLSDLHIRGVLYKPTASLDKLGSLIGNILSDTLNT